MMLRATVQPFVVPEKPLLERSLNTLRVSFEGLVRTLNLCPIIVGVHITDIEMSSGTASIINHTLGREPRGYIVTRSQSAIPSFYETDRDSKTITFMPSANCTVDIWFF